MKPSFVTDRGDKDEGIEIRLAHAAHRGKRTCGRQVPEPVKAVLTLPVFEIENVRTMLATEKFHSIEWSNRNDEMKPPPLFIERLRGLRRKMSFSAEQAEHVGDKENQQYCPQAYPGPATRTPAAIAVVSATAAKNQYQNDNEYQHRRSSFLLDLRRRGSRNSYSFFPATSSTAPPISATAPAMGSNGMLCVFSRVA
jgi:hypothetical protein